MNRSQIVRLHREGSVAHSPAGRWGVTPLPQPVMRLAVPTGKLTLLMGPSDCGKGAQAELMQGFSRFQQSHCLSGQAFDVADADPLSEFFTTLGTDSCNELALATKFAK